MRGIGHHLNRKIFRFNFMTNLLISSLITWCLGWIPGCLVFLVLMFADHRIRIREELRDNQWREFRRRILIHQDNDNIKFR